ncbi:MAG: hypothetical protein K8T20_18305 [Planctomycetes bacterium]|nr:hypothetical protein [Planctomycetota bacterium]
MSGCSCDRDFPARTFKTASDADDWMSRIRMSSAFRYVATDGVGTQRERYRCRACGADWACTVPPEPPYSWGPLVVRRDPPAETAPIVVPSPRGTSEKTRVVETRPFAIPVDGPPPPPPKRPPPPPILPAETNAPFLEVGPNRVPSDVFTMIYEDEAAGDVPRIMRALVDWRPGLWSWKANAGFQDIEIEVGAPVAKGKAAFDLFAKTWNPDLVNPAWRGLRGGKGLRPVQLRGIRERGTGKSGFVGEYYLVIVDAKAEKVSAWMMAEAKP